MVERFEVDFGACESQKGVAVALTVLECLERGEQANRTRDRMVCVTTSMERTESEYGVTSRGGNMEFRVILAL